MKEEILDIIKKKKRCTLKDIIKEYDNGINMKEWKEYRNTFAEMLISGVIKKEDTIQIKDFSNLNNMTEKKRLLLECVEKEECENEKELILKTLGQEGVREEIEDALLELERDGKIEFNREHVSYPPLKGWACL